MGRRGQGPGVVGCGEDVGACWALEKGRGLCFAQHRLVPAIPLSTHLILPGGASPQFCLRSWPFLHRSLSCWVSLSRPLPPYTHTLLDTEGGTGGSRSGVCCLISLGLRPSEVGPKSPSFELTLGGRIEFARERGVARDGEM